MMDELLPELLTGVYQHFRGPLYLVLGYAHDANADELYSNRSGVARSTAGGPLGQRNVVVYIGLQLTEAHTGPRLAVRTADDFFAKVHLNDGSRCNRFTSSAKDERFPAGEREYFCQDRRHPTPYIVSRFKYVGATYEPGLVDYVSVDH